RRCHPEDGRLSRALTNGSVLAELGLPRYFAKRWKPRAQPRTSVRGEHSEKGGAGPLGPRKHSRGCPIRPAFFAEGWARIAAHAGSGSSGCVHCTRPFFAAVLT